jgi:galactosamine-6-phosphate isomerase
MKAVCDSAASEMDLEVADDYEAVSRRAEQLIVSDLKRKPGLILCASAGNTPTRTYELLAARAVRQPRLFAEMRVLQIDEWGGLARGNPGSCEHDLRVKLLEPLGIDRERYIGFRSDAAHPEAECDRIAEWLASNGPIDICLLGLGMNGHVAMNEPGQSAVPQAHLAKLSRSSLQHPMLRHMPRKPTFGLTIGLGDILRSRRVLLLVNGRHKRAALERLMTPEVTPRFPASFLWLHPRATILCDQEAAPAWERRRLAGRRFAPRISPAGRRRSQVNGEF